MAEEISEYLVIAYIDDLEEAMAAAKKHEMFDIGKGLDSLHGALVELGNMAESEERLKRLKADIDKPLQDLVKVCQEGSDAEARGNMRILRDKVHTLKAIWNK